MPRTANHVASVATKPAHAPRKIGLAMLSFLRASPAVMAARTRMLSSPSRKTSTLMSRIAAAWLVFGAVGSGLPCEVRPCQMSSARIGSSASPPTIHTPRCQLAEGAGAEISSCMVEVCMQEDAAGGSGPLTVGCYLMAFCCGDGRIHPLGRSQPENPGRWDGRTSHLGQICFESSWSLAA